MFADSKSQEKTGTAYDRWRVERSTRIGRRFAGYAVPFCLIAAAADMTFATHVETYTDFIAAAAAMWSLHLFNVGHRFAWVPLWLAFWIGSLPVMYSTGGFLSPFLGLYLALFFVSLVIVIPRAKVIPCLGVVGVNFLLWFGLTVSGQLPPAHIPLPVAFAVYLLEISAGFVLMLCFIRSERDLTAELQQRFEQQTIADEANMAKTTFLANVSHEIRTPLSAVMGFAELLRAPGLSEADRQMFGDKIKQSGQKLARLVDDLLDLSKIEAGHLQFERIDFSPRTSIDEVASTFRPLAHQKNLRFEFWTEPSVPETICSDPLRFHQVVTNLVSNAVKFTDRGSIVIKMQASEHELTVEVRDTGCGLDDTQRLRIFKPFSQADASTTRRYGGTGLGLDLSLKLARGLRGNLVLAESAPDRGSVFVFTVPLAIEVGKSRSAPAPSELGRAQPDGLLSGMRVLIAEDVPETSFVYGEFLRSAGASVGVATDGLQAIDAAEKSHFDVILMDMQMPRLDGYNATRILRERGFNRPIVALTAHAMQGEKQRCLAAGCDAHLSKPIDAAELVRSVYTTAISGRAPEISPAP